MSTYIFDVEDKLSRKDENRQTLIGALHRHFSLVTIKKRDRLWIKSKWFKRRAISTCLLVKSFKFVVSFQFKRTLLNCKLNVRSKTYCERRISSCKPKNAIFNKLAFAESSSFLEKFKTDCTVGEKFFPHGANEKRAGLMTERKKFLKKVEEKNFIDASTLNQFRPIGVKTAAPTCRKTAK
uniref:Uncharacterized protein n=1 Tax=Romanomermis culicivorax TaxID=13658 RepID=A0A915JLS8_ROMCU